MGTRRKPKGVYKRGRFWWHRNPETGQRETTGCTDREAAEAFHAKSERRAADPSYAAQDAATLVEWIGEVMAAKSARRAAGTVRMYQQKAGHLRRIFGDRCRLSDITPKTVDRFVNQRLEEGAAQATVYKELVVLTQVLKAARRTGEFRAEPRSLLPTDWSSGYTPRTRALTPAEVWSLIHKCTREEHAAWIAFVVATGARLAEANRNEPADLDAAERLVRLHGTKTKGAARAVPVLEIFQPMWDLVLAFWEKHGRGPRWAAASTSLAGVAERAKLGRVSPNDLRRTYASLLIASGIEQGLVSRLMGHRDTTMVARVYGQVTPVQLATLVRRQLPSGTNETHSAPCAPEVDAADAENPEEPDPNDGGPPGFKIRRGSPSCGFESHLWHSEWKKRGRLKLSRPSSFLRLANAGGNGDYFAFTL
ncbi:MAG TPA: tyrosine-type recombinase/integrase [Polyangiaceae bacterium]|nr:tyrosine-type recombinase/integrase [Polyangiaceae bacterium]